MALSDSTLLSKIGWGILIAALVFDLIGFPTPYWFGGNGTSFGLFSVCDSTGCATLQVAGGWHAVARGLNVLGFFLGLASLIDISLYVTVKNDKKVLQLVGFILALIAGCFILIGSSVFVSKAMALYGLTSSHVRWSFGLTIFSSLLYLAAGIVEAVDKVKGRASQ